MICIKKCHLGGEIGLDAETSHRRFAASVCDLNFPFFFPFSSTTCCSFLCGFCGWCGVFDIYNKPCDG